jgi:hypothetical protein
MTRRLFTAMAALLLCGSSVLMAQESSPQTVIQFPGTCLKWSDAAKPTITEEHLKLENYMISVIDEHDHVTVSLKSLDAPQGSKGSGGTHAGYVVEIRKTDSKILRSYYLR